MGLRFSTGIGPIRYSIPLTPRTSRSRGRKMTKAEAQATSAAIAKFFEWTFTSIAFIFILTYYILKWSIVAMWFLGVALYACYQIKFGDEEKSARGRESLQNCRDKLTAAFRSDSAEEAK